MRARRRARDPPTGKRFPASYRPPPVRSPGRRGVATEADGTPCLAGHRAQRAQRGFVEGNPPPGGAHHRLRPQQRFTAPSPFPRFSQQALTNSFRTGTNSPSSNHGSRPSESASIPRTSGCCSTALRARRHRGAQTTWYRDCRGGIAPETLSSLCNGLHCGTSYRGDEGAEKGEKQLGESGTFEASDRSRGPAHHQLIG